MNVLFFCFVYLFIILKFQKYKQQTCPRACDGYSIPEFPKLPVAAWVALAADGGCVSQAACR